MLAPVKLDVDHPTADASCFRQVMLPYRRLYPSLFGGSAGRRRMIATWRYMVLATTPSTDVNVSSISSYMKRWSRGLLAETMAGYVKSAPRMHVEQVAVVHHLLLILVDRQCL